MAELVLETEQHVSLLNELTQLFKEKMDVGSDSDIFMDVCLRFSLDYHQEFLDGQTLRKLIEKSIQETTTAEPNEDETVYN